MRRWTAAVLVVLGATLGMSTARGQDPCSGYAIPPVLISPEAGRFYEIYFLPLPECEDIEVKVRFPPALCDLLVLCDRPYSVCDTTCDGISFVDTTESAKIPGTKITGYRARFEIRGGGCWDERLVSNPANLAQIYVDGELVRQVGVRSPDVVDGTPLFPWELWCESPPETAGFSLGDMSDAVFLSPFMKTGEYTPCADMNGDGAVNINDAVIVTPALKLGATCGEQ